MKTRWIDRICDRLDACYGREEWTEGRPILDELIYTILSQNTSSRNCEEAFRTLTERFCTWEAVMAAPVEEIANAIKCGGLANIKAPRIKRILEQIDERQSSLDLQWIADTPDAEASDYLLGFDGVGRKTAACVLMFSLGRPVLPVDTHVHRVAMRLGIIGSVSADAAHDLLQEMLEHRETVEGPHPEPVEGSRPETIAGRVYSFHINMVTHGRQICHARGPECPRCCIKDLCDYYKSGNC